MEQNNNTKLLDIPYNIKFFQNNQESIYDSERKYTNPSLVSNNKIIENMKQSTIPKSSDKEELIYHYFMHRYNILLRKVLRTINLTMPSIGSTYRYNLNIFNKNTSYDFEYYAYKVNKETNMSSLNNYLSYINFCSENNGPVFVGLASLNNNMFIVEKSSSLTFLNTNIEQTNLRSVNLIILLTLSYISRSKFYFENFTIKLIDLKMPIDIQFKYGDITYYLTNLSIFPLFLFDEKKSFVYTVDNFYLNEINNYNDYVNNYLSLNFPLGIFPGFDSQLNNHPLYIYLDFYCLSQYKDLTDLCYFSTIDPIAKAQTINSLCDNKNLMYGSVHLFDARHYIKLNEDFCFNIDDDQIEELNLNNYDSLKKMELLFVNAQRANQPKIAPKLFRFNL